ncbi:MAG TPA: ATP-binding protein [Pirellulales bacterium]|nr:ATP-binding protein [Pirellulales bacterium]
MTAIRNGEVDALVIGGKEIYTLEGADHPYRVLVEAMQQGAVTLSPGGAVIYCNTGFAEMMMRPAEKIIGASIESLFATSAHSILARQLSGTGTARQTELTLKADDGTWLPVLVSFTRLPLDDVMAVCLVITDLTEQKHNLQLQDTDRRKDEFLAMLAHELRNPLAPIANAAQMLCLWNKGADKEVQSACDVVARQVRQMTRIVDDLLDISRITRGKIKLQKTAVDVSSVISAAVETSRPLIESRQHKLNITVASGALRINADITRMAQAVTNLLNNAAKYTEEGGEIWLSVDRDGSDATITVRDNGVGIPVELLPSVFDLFTQADRTIDRSQGGLGIGLTLVRSLVELHQGSVSASSDGPGKGSKFVVRVPLIAASERYDHENSGEINGAAATFPQRVLVVDDNVDSATTLALMLKTMGHETSVAHDGPTAIELAQTFRPTLVLLDIGLPALNGYLVAQRLRTMPALRGVVLAALTGYGEDQDRRRSKEAGFDVHFVKPVRIGALQDLIASLPKAMTVASG